MRDNRNYAKAFRDIPPTSLEHYAVLKLIGKGAFATVSLGVHKLTGKYVAIKTISKSYIKDAHAKKKVLQEVYIHRKMKHPNIIRYVSQLRHHRLLEVFEGPTDLFIVMEYAAGGDLLEYVKKKGRLPTAEARTLFRQIVYGLGHIHARSVIHRDIKLDNIFLDEHNNPKIGDFGVSKLISKTEKMDEQCGTPAYLAPEIIRNQASKILNHLGIHWLLSGLLESRHRPLCHRLRCRTLQGRQPPRSRSRHRKQHPRLPL